MTEEIKIRKALPEDVRFVHSSWFTSFWSETAFRSIPREIYLQEQDKRIDKLLRASETKVAFLEEVPDEILGYAVLQGPVCHWTYVKGVYRRRGIASRLVTAEVKFLTALPGSVGKKFATQRGLVYNPYLLEG